MKIEKGVPMPKKNSSGGYKYPFIKMEVGDSLFIPSTEADIIKVRSAAFGFGRLNKMTFTTLSVDGGCRVWRRK